MARVLGSSLYATRSGDVVARELIQNAVDAARESADKLVDVDINHDRGVIRTWDSGKGMTPQEVATVFTNLGASGKRTQELASGGFGLAKAAILLMGKRVRLDTVAEVGGKKIRTQFEATPEELLRQGVKPTIEEVDPSRKTYTQVEVDLSGGEGTSTGKDVAYAAFVAAKAASQYNRSGVRIRVDGRDYAGRVGPEVHSGNLTEGANVSLAPTQEYREFRGTTPWIHVHVLSNGMYQFSKVVYVPKSVSHARVPVEVLADIRPTVQEGSPDYPFTANRDSLRDTAKKGLERLVLEQILEPAAREGAQRVTEAIKSIPVIRIGRHEIQFWDPGKRFEPHEIESLQKNRDFRRVAATIVGSVKLAMRKLRESGEGADIFDVQGIGEDVGSVGLIASSTVRGVYTRAPGQKKASILINPFVPARALASEAANAIRHTIVHELTHDRVSDHYDAFTSTERDVYAALGSAAEIIYNNLARAFGQGGRKNAPIREGISEAIRIYQEAQRRPGREVDVVGRYEVSREAGLAPAGGQAQGPGGLPRGGEGGVRYPESPPPTSVELAQARTGAETHPRELAPTTADRAAEAAQTQPPLKTSWLRDAMARVSEQMERFASTTTDESTAQHIRSSVDTVARLFTAVERAVGKWRSGESAYGELRKAIADMLVEHSRFVESRIQERGAEPGLMFRTLLTHLEHGSGLKSLEHSLARLEERPEQKGIETPYSGLRAAPEHC